MPYVALLPPDRYRLNNSPALTLPNMTLTFYIRIFSLYFLSKPQCFKKFQLFDDYLEHALPFLFIAMHKDAKQIVKSLLVTFCFFLLCIKIILTAPSVIDATYPFLGKFEAGMVKIDFLKVIF